MDGSQLPQPTALECPLCSGENIDDGGFCLRCKELVCVIVPAPEWLVREFGSADADGTWSGASLDDMIHDYAWKFDPVDEDDFDPEDFAPSESELRRDESTWSV